MPVLCVGQLLQLRSEVSKFMRFVVSDKDAEQLAALQVPHYSVSICSYSTRVLCATCCPHTSGMVLKLLQKNAMSLTYVIAWSGYKTGNHEKLMPKTQPLHQMVSVYMFPVLVAGRWG